MTFRDRLEGIQFRSRWELNLQEWISTYWNEINNDEWFLYEHIIDAAMIYTDSGIIRYGRFRHESYYEDGHKILKITIDFQHKCIWYKISFPIRLDINAYKYDPREGF